VLVARRSISPGRSGRTSQKPLDGFMKRTWLTAAQPRIKHLCVIDAGDPTFETFSRYSNDVEY